MNPLWIFSVVSTKGVCANGTASMQKGFFPLLRQFAPGPGGGESMKHVTFSREKNLHGYFGTPSPMNLQH